MKNENESVEKKSIENESVEKKSIENKLLKQDIIKQEKALSYIKISTIIEIILFILIIILFLPLSFIPVLEAIIIFSLLTGLSFITILILNMINGWKILATTWKNKDIKELFILYGLLTLFFLIGGPISSLIFSIKGIGFIKKQKENI
ncbi:MAG: hypothetical protein ACRDA7_02270 [Metamycoplasmataceae bacterium]